MKTILSLISVAVAACAVPARADSPAATLDHGKVARAALDRLKSLAGQWLGPEGEEVVYQVVSGGHTVMENLFPGRPHNMVSMYHLDGTNLVCTHFCAMGNQPRMQLNVAKSTPDELTFEFRDGANLDPARDVHVHAGRIRLAGGDRLEAEWYVMREGRITGTNRFQLYRPPPPPPLLPGEPSQLHMTPPKPPLPAKP